MERLGHSSIRVTLDTHSHAIGGLQEAAAQRFDEFLSAKSKSEQNVGKMSVSPTKVTQKYAENSLGAAGFEPATT